MARYPATSAQPAAEPLIAISLGWGVQSFTLAVMSALGDLPPVDVAIHADTTHERSATYAFAQRWTPWLEAHGVRVVTVQGAQSISELTSYKSDIPAYTSSNGALIMVPEIAYDDNDEAYQTGEMIEVPANVEGRLRRQCTGEWKIYPMRRWLQANRDKRPVEQWLGISMDEWQRAKDSDVKYVTNRFPLLELKMTRNDCGNYLERHGIEVPPKSACVFCPFHNMRAWVEMKAENGADWQKAVEVDAAIRKARPPYDLFLHRAMIPLIEVDLRTPEDKGQMALWQEACESGYCWT